MYLKPSGKSVRLFESEALEKLSHVHPITPLVVWAPIISLLFYRTFTLHALPILSVAGLGIVALLVWTLAEYLLHRYLFHIEPEQMWLKKVQFIIHGNHHDFPEDPTRLVMPPAASLILGVIFYTLFRATLGPVWVDPFFAFFLIGYLCYDYIHYSVHHFTPRTPVGRWLKQSHMLHHFVSHETRWGVSSPLWDYVFGTQGKRPALKTSSQARRPVT